MRYIGNKENIIEKIYSILVSKNITGESFFDFFAGTTSVGKYFKKFGYKIFSSDLMYMSYCLQKAYIENNDEPKFEKLLQILNFESEKNLLSNPLDLVLEYLDKIPQVQGFIYQNYTPSGSCNLTQPRMYFSDENGQQIDAIRQKIEEWKSNNLISENEYFILISCLLESVSFYANIAGVYGAFYKKWDPRALKKLELRQITFFDNKKKNKVFNKNSLDLLNEVEADIFYLDPPYNARQYLPNYHILETIAKYDNPQIHGVTGIRDYENKKSRFCNSKTALEDLEKIAKNGKYKYLVLSYNSEGIMNQSDIIKALEKYGKVEFEQFEYTRFKSNNNGLSKTKKHVFEQVYILKKETENGK